MGESAYIVAERLHEKCDERAVDYWARAVAWTAEAMREGEQCSYQSTYKLYVLGHRESFADRAAQIHNSAMIRILSQGQAYGRLDPSSHLQINGANQTVRIPVIHHGFAWQRSDFQQLLVFEPPPGAPGNVCGRGVPLVVLSAFKARTQSGRLTCDGSEIEDLAPSQCESFIDSQTPFAATALMEIPVAIFLDETCERDEGPDVIDVGSVTLVNPLVIDPGTNGGLDEGPAIAQSPAMPLDYARQSSRYNPLRAFLSGDNGIDQPRLRFLEPYSPDKIPLLLVHGLLSDPAVYLQIGEAVHADPLLRQRYQIWLFRYPTGDNVLNSAASLRRQLAAAYACAQGCDCPSRSAETLHLEAGNSPAHRAVIVGHSMGGLLSKLQVTDSGDRLWRSVANVPFEQLQGSPKLLKQLHESFFFRASPNIGRVVYIATPHRGSQWASRCIGRLGSTLAGIWGQERDDYEIIVRDNPGVFSGQYSDSFPSSVEMLRPNSHLLETLAATPSTPSSVINSIIGKSCWWPRSGWSDTVVPVSSAYRANAESTTLVDATHTAILQSHAAQQTLLEILRVHLSTLSETATPPALEDDFSELDLHPALLEI